MLCAFYHIFLNSGEKTPKRQGSQHLQIYNHHVATMGSEKEGTGGGRGVETSPVSQAKLTQKRSHVRALHGQDMFLCHTHRRRSVRPLGGS